METGIGRWGSCTILVVDDDPAMRSLLVDELSENGCQVVESYDGHDALSKLKTCPPNLIITDLKMPGGGFDYLERLCLSVQHCPIILVTAFGNSQTKKQAQACGVATYFNKPVRINDLKMALQQVCSMVRSQPCQNTVFWNSR